MGAGQFLQVSGFKLVYDIQQPSVQRLVSALVLTDGGYTDLEPHTEYDVLTSSYVAGGGDGYYGIAQHKLRHEIGPLDTEVIRNYLEAASPVHPLVQGNIVFKEEDDDDDTSTNDIDDDTEEDNDESCWTL